MSDSSLSPPPRSELSLLTMQEAPFVPPPGIHHPLQLRQSMPKLRLPKSDSVLFTASLFSCTLLDTTLATIQFRCLQL
jgi:hypothetical protein